MRFNFTREFYIPKNAIKVVDKQSDAIAYLYDNESGKPCAMIFLGKQNKPLWRYRFPDAKRRETAIRQAFENRRAHNTRNSERRSARKNWIPTYKVGDILRTSWGYEQTNVEYFEIIEIRGKHAILRELAQERSETGWLQGNCVPLPGSYLEPRHEGDKRGQPIRRLMQEGHIKIDDVRTAWPVETKNVGGVKVIPPTHWSAYH